MHKNLNVEDGLVYSQALSIYQDSKGYLWIGTSNGVSRWDGIKFKNFYSSNKVAFDNVKMMAETDDKKLFIATGSGVLIQDDGNFIKPNNYPNGLKTSINQLIKAKDGTFYLAAEDSGLWQYNGKKFEKITTPPGIQNLHVISLTILNSGNLLIGTKKNGIFELNNRQLTRFDLRTNSIPLDISYLYQDSKNNLFIGTNKDGLFYFDGKSKNRVAGNERLEGDNINYIYQSSNGEIYVTTNREIAVVRNLEISATINTENGLANNFVWCVCEDDQGNIYFGTDGGGFNVYRPGIFQTYNQTSGLPHNTVWNIFETSDNTYYFSTDEGVAILKNDKIEILSKNNGLSDNMIINVFESSNGEMFFGTNDFGVDILNNGRIKNISIKNGLTSNSVWSITEDEKGRIYLGTYDGGICVYDNGKIVNTFDSKNGLPNNYIVSSYKSKSGVIYFGLDKGGVIRFINGKLDENYNLFPGSTIWSMFENEAGTFYYGTDKSGLICVSESKIDTITINDGLSNNTILGIMNDEFGKLYLTTDNGLNIVDCSTQKPEVRIITSEDGLASSECNQGAFLKDSKGLLWIGTIKGVTRYNPSKDIPILIPPQTHITQVKVFDKEIDYADTSNPIQLNYDQNYLQFGFVGIDLIAPHKVQYKYRLNGAESEWFFTEFPNVQFANLPDNEYTFEVQAGNEWESWSESQFVKFSILPPFWATWWFRTLAFIVLAGIIAALIYLRFRSLLAIERVRSKIAADLHDDIGAGLSEINILSAVAESKTPPEAKRHIENELTKISKTAGLMIENMSDIVWMVNPKNDLMVDLVARLKDNFNDMFDAKHIVFQSENSMALEKIRLNMEQRQNIFLIFKEAINNAIKYSDCSQLNLCVKREGNILKITLQDNGIGFNADTIKNGNGLNNMKMRAKNISGNLSVESNNSGTMIEFIGKI